VVYATGNHDPGSPDTGPRRLPWPSCVRVADDATPRRFLVHGPTGEPVGYVTAVGHATSQERSDLSRALPRPAGELPEVALLHTQVHSSPGSEHHHPYAPSELTYLVRAGFDYWALGHVHARQALSDDPPIWYSGSLQGRTHADRGERGALLVDLSNRGAPSVSFRPLAPVRWETVEVERLDSVRSLDELERHVQVGWRALRDADPGASAVEWMIRVVLRGPCPLWSELQNEEDRELLGRELREILGGLDVVVTADEVHPVVDVEEHRLRTDVLGEALRLARAVQRGEERLPVEPTDLVGVTSDDPAVAQAYARGLLDGAEGEIASRMLEGRTAP